MNKLEELELRVEELYERYGWAGATVMDIVFQVSHEPDFPLFFYYTIGSSFPKKEEYLMRKHIMSFKGKELPTIAQLVKELNELEPNAKFKARGKNKVKDRSLIKILQCYSVHGFEMAAKILQHNAITPLKPSDYVQLKRL